MKHLLRNSFAYRLLGLLLHCVDWSRRGFAAPSPQFVKQACVCRNAFSNATWVETGTYLGQTTQVLSEIGAKVYTIEPEPTLFARAKRYFNRFPNVEVLGGTSEHILPGLLAKIRGDVNFWLDGHYSAGITFKGPQDTPILDELKCISENLGHFARVCVMIDDVRCFNPHQSEYSTYPPLDALVDWARSNNLHWHIEHDIFVARTKSSDIQRA